MEGKFREFALEADQADVAHIQRSKTEKNDMWVLVARRRLEQLGRPLLPGPRTQPGEHESVCFAGISMYFPPFACLRWAQLGAKLAGNGPSCAMLGLCSAQPQAQVRASLVA